MADMLRERGHEFAAEIMEYHCNKAERLIAEQREKIEEARGEES
jgi:hypothetical protein